MPRDPTAPDDVPEWLWAEVSPPERQVPMSPSAPIRALRAEMVSRIKSCASDISECRKEQAAQREWCNKCRSETREALEALVHDVAEQKRLDSEYRRASSELSNKHNRILRKLLDKIGCELEQT